MKPEVRLCRKAGTGSQRSRLQQILCKQGKRSLSVPLPDMVPARIQAHRSHAAHIRHKCLTESAPPHLPLR
jgi:hypothetical protein